MKTENYSPRFVHVPDYDISSKHHGFTIAYYRTNEEIFFSVALVSKNDVYVRKTGREFAMATLDKYIDSMSSEFTYMNFKDRIGCIKLDFVLSHDSVSSVLGDHAVSKLTMMDFKHAFLSDILASWVIMSSLTQ